MHARLHREPKCMRQPVGASLHVVLYPANTWAAQHNTWLLLEIDAERCSAFFPFSLLSCQHPALTTLCDPGLGASLVLSLIWMLVLRLFCQHVALISCVTQVLAPVWCCL